MHGGAAVVAFQETPRSTADDDYLPAADNKMSTQQPPSSSSDDNDGRRRLEGKVAIVTGGARGVGEAIARLFVAHGARVVIADVVDDAAAAASPGPPERCSYERCDVSVEADVERAVRRAVARHGRLDVLCNAAGAGRGRQARGSILALDAAELERAVRVNALGAALGMKHAAGAMIAAGEGGGGSIVSVASVAGGMGPRASEHALVGLTENAACELGRHGIRVNCISPFGVEQQEEEEEEEEVVAPTLTLKQQGATLGVGAIDIAEAALFLASDDSRYVSGHNLVVDGGVTTASNRIGL